MRVLYVCAFGCAHVAVREVLSMIRQPFDVPQCVSPYMCYTRGLDEASGRLGPFSERRTEADDRAAQKERAALEEKAAKKKAKAEVLLW